MLRYTFIAILVGHRMSTSAGSVLKRLQKYLIFNGFFRNITKRDY